MSRRTPLWVRGAPSPDFLDDPKRACATPTGRPNDLFFDETIEGLETVRNQFCGLCPRYRDCTRWTLAHYEDLEFGIYAGLNQETRRRIHEGKERYFDWRPEWHRSYFNAMKANRVSKSLRKSGQGKRQNAKATMPPCPYCGQTNTVCKNGRSTNRHIADRQRYRCVVCKRNFLGEDL